MTPELWQRLKPLFHAALDREPGKRVQFIDEACAEDAELKLHLHALMQAEKQAAESLDQQFSPEKLARMRIIYAKLLNAPEGERIALAHRLCEGDGQIEWETQRLISALDKAGRFRDETETAAPSDAGLESAGRNLSPGTVLASRFRILRPVDSGGMGSVYQAWDSELQETLALKTILPEIASEQSVIERFKREVKQAHQVTHPNICRVYDLFNHDFGPGNRIWFLTMQLLKGSTLLEHIRKKGPFTRNEALPLVEQMVAGLTAAHEIGIVHRDFKSSNVMLVQEAKHSIRVVITDFGLASQATSLGHIGTWRGRAHLRTWLRNSGLRASWLRREINTHSAWSCAKCSQVSGPLRRSPSKLFRRVQGCPWVRSSMCGGNSQSAAASKSSLKSASPRSMTFLRPSIPAHVADSSFVGLQVRRLSSSLLLQVSSSTTV
jgi:hypothetical protein